MRSLEGAKRRLVYLLLLHGGMTQQMCFLWCAQAKQEIATLHKKLIEAEQQVKSLQAVSGHVPLHI